MQDAYARTSLVTHYALRNKVGVLINLNNVFDKKCIMQNVDFDTVGYGTRRNALMTLNDGL